MLFFALISLYLCVSFTKYIIVTSQNSKQHPPGTRTTSVNVHGLSSKGKYLNVLAVFSVLFALIRCVFDIWMLSIVCTSDTICKVYDMSTGYLYMLAIGVLFFILWFRMKLFYSHPMMNIMRSRVMKVFSIIALLFLLILTLSQGPLQYVYSGTNGTKSGCRIDGDNWPELKLRPITVLAGILMYQVMVLLLLIVPLLKERRLASNSTKRSVQIAVRRLCFSTIFCLLVNMSICLVALSNFDRYLVYTNIAYDGCLLLNVLGVTYSFSDWRNRIWIFHNGTVDAGNSCVSA